MVVNCNWNAMDITAVIQRNNTTGENMTVQIKQERPDEREINEMAAAIKAANQNKMAQMQQNQANRPQLGQLRPGQQVISTYFGNNRPVVNGQSSPNNPEESDEESQGLDLWSIMGRFGWTKLGREFVPYIFRSKEEYCAVKMVENKLLNKYLQYLPQDVYSCTCIRSYFITENESKLLNEINFKHCDSQFGKESFTTKDLVVRLTDAEQFYNFLETCYRKICVKVNDANGRCGFFRINGESVVPYTVKSGVKYVPLFYFEGETENLKQKAQSVEGWELSYLKFCCKVQGIRNELFASERCQVVSFDDIKSHFPANTVFEDWWPQKNPLQQMGGGVRPSAAAAGTMWTQKAQSTTAATPHSTSSSVMYRNAWNNAPVPSTSRLQPVPSTPTLKMTFRKTPGVTQSWIVSKSRHAPYHV